MAYSPNGQSFPLQQDGFLSHVFHFGLRDKSAKGGYLADLARELEEEGDVMDLLLSTDNLERALVSRLSKEPPSPEPHFDYLLDCWRRARAHLWSQPSRVKGSVFSEQRTACAKAAMALLVSYAAIVLTMPDMFPQTGRAGELDGRHLLMPRLLQSEDVAAGIPHDFLTQLILRLVEDGLETVMGGVLEGMREAGAGESFHGGYNGVLMGMVRLLQYKPVVDVMVRGEGFLPPGAQGRALEGASTLGPVFRYACLPPEYTAIAEAYFGQVERQGRGEVEGSFHTLRGIIHNYQDGLLGMVNSLLRASGASREGTLRYMKAVVESNLERGKMRPDLRKASSDGFILNWNVTLLRLCEPFTLTPGKMDRIAGDYFLRSGALVDAGEETRLTASQEEAGTYLEEAKKAGGAASGGGSGGGEELNFISHAFFLACALQHYGFQGTVKRFLEVEKYVRDATEEIRDMEGTGGGLDAAGARMVEVARARLRQLHTLDFAYRTYLFDEGLLGRVLHHSHFTATWLLRSVDPTGRYPEGAMTLPLPVTPPRAFAVLPEYILEDAVEAYIFALRTCPTQLSGIPLSGMVQLCVVLLGSPQYVKNPYLKAKLVELLYTLTFTYPGLVEEGEGNVLNRDALALRHLMPGLMRFYVDVEQTGQSSQFYDKFNIRYNISQILATLWKGRDGEGGHRGRVRAMTGEGEGGRLFIRFVNLLMNDTTYLLDESISKLREIRTIEQEMERREEWAARPEEERKGREEALATGKRMARSYVGLGNETVRMLSYMTKEVPGPFLRGEIIDRLAAMLDYNLNTLAGPKCSELKVRDPGQYRFEPRTLLKGLVEVYLHLSGGEEFALAISRDGRSYKQESFSRAAGILRKFSLLQEKEIAQLGRLVEQVEGYIQREKDAEEELGDIPDEFLDPLMYTLMEDPVVVPTSQITMDRSTITSHLLSDPTDPFNRKPLTLEMIVPDEDMKRRIAEWRESKRGGGGD